MNKSSKTKLTVALARRTRISLAAMAFVSAAALPAQGQTAADIDLHMANLANQLTTRINGTPGWRVAVVPFTVGSGLSSDMSEYMVRTLTTHLVNHSNVDIVERQLLSAAMNEMKLQTSGAFDRASMVELGKLLGANAVITGSATPFQDALSIHAVVLDVQKGLNVGAGAVRLPRESRTASGYGSVTPERQIHEPVLTGPRVQNFNRVAVSYSDLAQR